MSAWVAAAVVGSAVVGAVSADKAAGKAAKGQDKALKASEAAAEQAREDVQRLFGEAAEQQTQGFSSAAEFLGGNIGAQVAPFQQGNIQAQEQVGRGLTQQQNALLGLPTDFSGFQARSVGTPESFNIANPLAVPPPVETITQDPPDIGGNIPGGPNFDPDRFLRGRNNRRRNLRRF